MTRVELKRRDVGFTLSVEGHAGRSDVCSAVSTLACSLGAWLEENKIPHAERRGDGLFVLDFPEESDVSRFVMYSLKLLAIQWPENVSVL